MKKFNKNFGLLGWIALIAVVAMGATIGTNDMRLGAKTGADIFWRMGDGLFKWNDGTSQMQSSNDGVIFADIGSTTITDPVEFNSVSNPGAEVDTAGWGVYADAAGGSPVDGTGGSPAVTITRITSGQLRSIGSFRLTKDAVNRQGEGTSIDFTIEPIDRGRELEIIFEHQETANFVDDDIQVFVHNNDTPGLVTTTRQNLKDGVIEFRARFDADATDVNYRLIFHIATVSALAYNLEFDNVRVRPLVLNEIETGALGGLRMETANVTTPAGVPTVNRESGGTGSWISSPLVDNGVGDVTVNIVAGIFSAIPECICTALNGSSDFCSALATSSTVYDFRTRDDTGALNDANFSIICVGAR